MKEKKLKYYHQLGDQLSEIHHPLYTILVESEKLWRADLSEGQTAILNGRKYVVKDNAVYRDEKDLATGRNVFENEAVTVLVPEKDIFTIYIFPPQDRFLCYNHEQADLRLSTSARLIFLKDQVQIDSREEIVYLNDELIEQDGLYPFQLGDRLATSQHFIEKRKNQWKVSSLFDKPNFNKRKVLIQERVNDYPQDFPEYRRSPRVNPSIHSGKIIINRPPQPIKPAKNSLIRAIVPAIGMFSLTALSSIWLRGNPMMMLGMGGFSLLTAATTMSHYFEERKDNKEQEKTRVQDYEAYLLKQVSELDQHYYEEAEILRYNQPEVKKLTEMIADYDSRIYERLDYNEDFLQLSLGLGDKLSQLELQTNFDEQSKDEISQFAQKVIQDYSLQKRVPITVNVAEATVGLVGNNEVTKTAVYNMLLQLATFHSYLDVNFINLVQEQEYERDWSEWRFLPHFNMQERNVRGFVHDARSRDAVLNSLYRIVQKRSQIKREMGDKDARFKPHYVLTIMDDSHLLGHSLNEYLAKDLTELGVTVIWVKEAKRLLPETITTLIEYKNQNAGQIINDGGVYRAQPFAPYPLLESYEKSVRTLANLKHVEVEKNTIPKSVTFLELYQVEQAEDLNLAARWSKADTSKTLAVPLGLRGKEDLVELNLHERAHGPHGLVAGTTGSGKSEILQSYILSLAVNFSPEDVGFLTIDFKGGGMANLFKDLPHMLGSITNLDGASSARALASIKAELHKRQLLFSRFGVNHINGYTKLYKEGQALSDKVNYPTKPLPHLFLISDEFAELKEHEPEFMTELVSTARIGRSLGVHLILATQKPSGVVNDQIWSNSRFKLALKVSDESDSNEIIKTPDAASITEPGRAYLQVGNNEIYELFQSAWSGAQYTPKTSGKEEVVDERIWLINDLGQFELLSEDLSLAEDYTAEQAEEVTELDAIVDYIATFSTTAPLNMPDKPWLEPLPTSLTSPVLEPTWNVEKVLSVPFARMDIPSEQKQENFNFNLEELGHTLFYGSPGFGKSVALQTLVMNLARLNTPSQVQFNLFDFGTNGLLPLKGLPHVADLTRLDEEEKLVKFLRRIDQVLKERKEKFAAYSVASLSQYEQKSGEKLPVILNLFDGFDSIKDTPFEEAIEGVINRILREGASLGCYVLLTALRSNSLKISMSSNITSRIVFFMVDGGAAREIIGRDALIQQEIFGRAQIKDEQAHAIQVYLPTQGDNDIDRLNHLEKEITIIDQLWQGERPAPIPMLPSEVTIEEFESSVEARDMLEKVQIPLGYDKETTAILGFNPKEQGYFIMLDDTPQQTELLEKRIMYAFEQLAGRVQRVVFDSDGRFELPECFDLIVSSDQYISAMNDIVGEMENRLHSGGMVQPMLVYLPDIHSLQEKILLTANTLESIQKNAGKVGIHFIFHGHQKTIETKFDEFFKRLRANMPAGTFGTRFMDQNMVKGKTDYKESLLEMDETHLFIGRSIYRIKLPR